MNLSIFGTANYDRSGKIRWLMEEMGLKYEDRWLDVEKNERDEGAYLNVNPLGRIPAVLIDDRPMIDSGAIVAYLADRNLEKGLAPALNSSDRLDYQQWMYFAATTIDQFAARIAIIEDIPPGEVLDNKLRAYMTETKEAVEFLNKALSNRDYLAKNFSAADICVGYHLYFASLWPELKEIIDINPKVANYLERLKNRAAAQKVKVFTFGS